MSVRGEMEQTRVFPVPEYWVIPPMGPTLNLCGGIAVIFEDGSH